MRMPSSPDTIVLIHGFWVTPRSWEHSKSHFEAKGYTVHAPGYPGFEVEAGGRPVCEGRRP
jgi:esterase/lipase